MFIGDNPRVDLGSHRTKPTKTRNNVTSKPPKLFIIH
jgi:hypothetical protein